MMESFDFLKKISFERIGGTEAELSVAKMLITECRKFAIEAHLEDFEIDGYEIKKASLETLDANFEVTGVGMSGQTPPEGIVGELFVVESLEQLEHISSLEGKICYVPSRMMVKTYKLLCEKKAEAFICSSGSLYDDVLTTDLEKFSLRERHYQFGKIPGVTIRMQDAQKLLLSKPKEVHLTLIQEEFKKKSNNVVATIHGSDLAGEIVCFTAHYDSVAFSTGAYDNGTGTTTILELLSYFAQNRPRRTLKFIWCGCEEMGLLGSKAYANIHSAELMKYRLCINVDMTGVVIGYDHACCTSEKELADYIKYLGRELGFPITTKQGVYSSDSTSFADCGVPAVSFARLAPKGGAEIHSRKDVMTYLDSENYYRTCQFIINFAQRMVNSFVFPVDRVIPNNIKDEIDVYLGRKEKEVK